MMKKISNIDINLWKKYTLEIPGVKSLDYGYSSICKYNNFYYLLLNLYNRGCIISKSSNLDDFSEFKVLFSYSNKIFDKEGNMEATQSFFIFDNKLYVICSSASGFGTYGDGHYICEIDTENLCLKSNIIGNYFKKIVEDNRLDTQPCIIYFKEKYILYTRLNIRTKERCTKIYTSKQLPFYNKNYTTIKFPYFIYSQNIIPFNNKLYGIFYYYIQPSNDYNTYKVCITESTDGIDFTNIIKLDLFPNLSVIPGTGYINIDETTLYAPFTINKNKLKSGIYLFNIINLINK